MDRTLVFHFNLFIKSDIWTLKFFIPFSLVFKTVVSHSSKGRHFFVFANNWQMTRWLCLNFVKCLKFHVMPAKKNLGPSSCRRIWRATSKVLVNTIFAIKSVPFFSLKWANMIFFKKTSFQFCLLQKVSTLREVRKSRFDKCKSLFVRSLVFVWNNDIEEVKISFLSKSVDIKLFVGTKESMRDYYNNKLALRICDVV